MNRLAVLVTFAASIGCGDNRRECGEGTQVDGDGFCVPAGTTPPICLDGTILDPTTNGCVIDPMVCQDGTVLIGNECRDPTGNLMPDATEGAEPNGLGLGGEVSGMPAGELELNPVGGAPVILRGNITPRPDRDEDGAPESDFDAFLFETTAPALIEVSVDGVGGVAGGFIAIGDATGLETWARFGVNLTGDMAKRQVFLPAAGVYVLGIADSRSLVNGDAVGDPANTYFASITQLPLPSPVTLTPTSDEVTHAGTITGNQIAIFAVPMGRGFNEADLTTFSSGVTGSLVVTVDNQVRSVSSESKSGTTDTPAFARIAGADPADQTWFVIDHEINTANTAFDFRLHVRTRDAIPLSTTGGIAAAGNVLDLEPFVTGLDELNAFYVEATAAGETIGLELAWNVPVDAILVDEQGAIASTFSWDPVFGQGAFFDGWGTYTFTDYRGLIRVPAAGRYYFLVNAPGAQSGDDVIATSTIAVVTPATLAFGTPVIGVAPNPFNSVAYDHAVDPMPWQLITLAANAASNGAALTLYDHFDAFGRLDSVVLDDGTGPAPVVGDPFPINILPIEATAGGTFGQGLITIDLPQRMFITVNTLANAGTFDLDVAARTYDDEGTHDGPYTVTHAAHALTADGTRRYLLWTQPGSTVDIALANVAAGLDVGIDELDYDELGLANANALGLGGAETLSLTATGSGYVAFRVYDAATPGTGTYDLTLTVTAPPTPPLPFYTATNGTTTWANACIGGTDVTPMDRDDGMTSPIMVPTGFTFFAAAATAIRISANGWLTFDTTTPITPSASFSPQPLPNAVAPNAVIAAYWNDLTNIRICHKTIGSTLVVQWRGNVLGETTLVAAQAILDTADDSIELVWAPFHEGDGTSASGGVESSTGSEGTSVLFDTGSSQLAGTAKKLTP